MIAGDVNADLCDGDSYKVACVGPNAPGVGPNAINQLLADTLVNTELTPASEGGVQEAALTGGANATHLNAPRFDTADFADSTPGHLRVDYVLPSANLRATGAGVFWPTRGDANFPLTGTFGNRNLFSGIPTSDHRAVWVDVTVVPEPCTWALMPAGSAFVTRCSLPAAGRHAASRVAPLAELAPGTNAGAPCHQPGHDLAFGAQALQVQGIGVVLGGLPGPGA